MAGMLSPAIANKENIVIGSMTDTLYYVENLFCGRGPERQVFGERQRVAGMETLPLSSPPMGA